MFVARYSLFAVRRKNEERNVKKPRAKHCLNFCHMDKEQKKKWRRDLAWFFMKVSVNVNGVLPLGFNYFLGSVLGRLAYCIVLRHRRVAMESLAVAFPEKSPGQRRQIARDFFVFMAQASFGLLYYLRHPERLSDVHVEGINHIDEALAKGKGVVLVSAHIGSFPLLSLKLASLGYPVNFVTRPMRDSRAGDYLYELRTKAGVKTIFSYPRRECVQDIIVALRRNEVVILQMDQNFGSGGVWVKFFGKLAATPVGPISLALRTQAAVVPAYIYQQSMDRHCIKIFSEERIVLFEDKDETILRNAIRLTRIIEGWIREHPCQWGWIHKRWKSRPSEQVQCLKFKVEE